MAVEKRKQTLKQQKFNEAILRKLGKDLLVRNSKILDYLEKLSA